MAQARKAGSHGDSIWLRQPKRPEHVGLPARPHQAPAWAPSGEGVMATWNQVLALHAEHNEWNSAQIARILGCDSGYVRATFKRRGIALQTTRKRRPNLQDWERQAILDAYKNGEKLEAVASEFGVHWTTVNKIGRRAGCKPRPHGRPGVRV